MDYLLCPDGDLLHAIDIALPTSRGLLHVVLASLFDLVYPLVPGSIRYRFAYETPRSYLRIIRNTLNIEGKVSSNSLSVLNLVLNPEVLVDPPRNTFNRIVDDDQQEIRHFRVATLLIHMRKKRSAV
jgi:hypothetical protein